MQRTEGSKLDGDCMGINNDAKSSCSVECTESNHSLNLSDELQFLRQKVFQLQTELLLTASKSLFRLKNIQDSDETVKCYTGFLDYATLFAFYEVILESDTTVMRQWDGKNCKSDYDNELNESKHG